MNKAQQIAKIQDMLGLLDQQTSHLGEAGTLTVSHYTCSDHLQEELNTLFKNYPIIVGHSSQLVEAGSFLTIDIGEVPVLVNRDRTGKLNAFINACRHRGARVCIERNGHARAFKCPYHAWSYMDDGSLRFIPKEEAFPDIDKDSHGLIPLQISEHAGFVWVATGSFEGSLSEYLSGVDADLTELGLPDHIVRVSAIQRPSCNWKLVIDAFSEGYHLQSLHKESVDPFFETHGALFEQMGLHSRSIGARKEILQARDLPEDEWDFRAWTTPFYTLFPNTVLVFHPDWISRITVFPDGTDRCIIYHDMLIPKDADVSAPHWDKTFGLINEQVFAAEDIAACESIQSAARSGADTHWPTGGVETPVMWFHDHCATAISTG